MSVREPRCLRFPSARPPVLAAHTDTLGNPYASSPLRDCSNSTPNASISPEALERDRAARVGGIGPVWDRRRQAGSRGSANLRGGDAGPVQKSLAPAQTA